MWNFVQGEFKKINKVGQDIKNDGLVRMTEEALSLAMERKK